MWQESVIWMTILVVSSGLPTSSRNLDDSRIIGGKVVPIEQFPFQVSIQFRNIHSCGGSILTENLVLTAGHCVHKNLEVRAGSNLTIKGGSLHQVVETFLHENFSAFVVPKNDIALLRVEPNFKFDSTRRPIKLHKNKKDIKDDALGTVSGWGVTSSGWISSRLQAVSVPVVNRDICSKTYLDLGFEQISEDFICGGFPEGGKDSCQGDSGGPFMVNGKLAGIVSYGYKCGQPKIPGVYTNVAHFYDWVLQHVKPKNTIIFP